MFTFSVFLPIACCVISSSSSFPLLPLSASPPELSLTRCCRSREEQQQTILREQQPELDALTAKIQELKQDIQQKKEARQKETVQRNDLRAKSEQARLQLEELEQKKLKLRESMSKLAHDPQAAKFNAGPLLFFIALSVCLSVVLSLSLNCLCCLLLFSLCVVGDGMRRAQTHRRG